MLAFRSTASIKILSDVLKAHGIVTHMTLAHRQATHRLLAQTYLELSLKILMSREKTLTSRSKKLEIPVTYTNSPRTPGPSNVERELTDSKNDALAANIPAVRINPPAIPVLPRASGNIRRMSKRLHSRQKLKRRRCVQPCHIHFQTFTDNAIGQVL